MSAGRPKAKVLYLIDETCRGREAEAGWVLRMLFGMKPSLLRETEQIGGDKSMAVFSPKRARNYMIMMNSSFRHKLF